MKKYRKIIAASALLCGGLLSANATTILLGSYGTTAFNPGVSNTATIYVPGSSTVNNKSDATYNISPGSTWHAALPGSSYISFDQGTGPNGSLVVPNGDYFYKSTFNVSAADAAATNFGTLTVLADDTVAVYLNGALILPSAGPMGPGNTYAMCSDVGPNCRIPLTFSFTGITAGLNELTFDVKQVNGMSEGLDFAGSITSAPEPASLALFGTGLLAMVGISRRYFSRS